MKIIDLEPNTEEWINFRKNKIGASDWPIILGESEYKTALELWQEKLGLSESTYTPAMKRGHEMEVESLKWFCCEYAVNAKPMIGVHDDYPDLMASFDGVDLDKQVICELKYIKKEYHDRTAFGHVPRMYWIQCQAQCFISGMEKVLYVSYKPENVYVVPVFRDDDFIASALPRILEFRDCLVNLKKPEMTERDYVERIDLNDLALNLKEYEDLASHYKSLAEISKQNLIDACNSHNSKGSGWKLTKSIRKGNVDYDNMLRQTNFNMELCDQYRKPQSVSHRITFGR